MTPEERFEALAEAPFEALTTLADRILATAFDVEVIHGPMPVALPIRIAIPAECGSAVIGHAAATACQVRLGGVRGDGMRPGRDLPGAVAAAVCDAEAERGGALQPAVTALAAESIASRADIEAARARAVALTTMETSR